MTTPDEPGHPGVGDGPNGNGSTDRTGTHRSGAGRVPGGDAPPRPRAGARPAQPQHRPPAEAPAQHDPRSAHTPGVEARLTRFIAGSAAPGAPTGAPPGRPTPPAAQSEAPPARSDVRSSEAYASELPDLSGPSPRPGQQQGGPARATPERVRDTPTGAGASRSGSRVEVGARSRGPLRAGMQIRRIDPWSTLKVSLVLSVALFFVWMIAVAFLYLVLGGMGVWSKLNSNVGDLLNNTSGSSTELVSSSTIFGTALLIGLLNIVLLTAMATIGAFVYNLTTDLIGGVEVTLADRD